MSDQIAHDTFEQHAGSFDPVVTATNYLNKYETNIAIFADAIQSTDPEYVKKVTDLFATWREELEKHKNILSADVYKQYEEKIEIQEQIKLNPTK